MITMINGFNIRQTGLRNIITSRAFITTLTEKINTEIISDTNVMNEITKIQYNHHIENMFYVAIYTGILYGAIVYFTYYKNTSQIEKLNSIEIYSKTKNKLNILLIVFIILFTKNIENAI
jgi:Na+/H+ antiporter NhaC